jgi:hypothetical protein
MFLSWFASRVVKSPSLVHQSTGSAATELVLLVRWWVALIFVSRVNGNDGKTEVRGCFGVFSFQLVAPPCGLFSRKASFCLDVQKELVAQ